jgi:uncharacterized SAM-binding protein YcdF (DUF218 family)
MTMTVLLIMLVLALVLARCGWPRCRRGLQLLTLVLFLGVGCGWLPMLMLRGLQTPYATRPALKWAPHNAIVLLTAGEAHVPDGPLEPSASAYGRIVQTAALYRDCKHSGSICTVLVSGGDPAGFGTPLAVIYASTLQRLGVAQGDLLLESRSLNTEQNAQFSRPLLQALGAPTTWLVTSAFHMSRATLYFTHFGIDVTPVRADYFDAVPSWRLLSSNFTLADMALHEYLAIADYHVCNVLGCKAPRMAPLTKTH